MSVPDESSVAARPALTVHYDGGCPRCTREIAAYRRMSGADACAWVDVTRCSPEALGPGLAGEAALARLDVRRSDGARSAIPGMGAC